MRLEIGGRLGLRDKNTLAFCWITDFPCSSGTKRRTKWTVRPQPVRDAKDGTWTDRVGPRPDARVLLRHRLQRLRVGEWLDPYPQARHPDLPFCANWATPKKQIRANFGHMLQAFEFGAPPHGGIAPAWTALSCF
jgi:aspartyl-tRNA synthetase